MNSILIFNLNFSQNLEGKKLQSHQRPLSSMFKALPLETDFGAHNFNPHSQSHSTPRTVFCTLMLNIPFSHYFQFTPDSDFSGLNK